MVQTLKCLPGNGVRFPDGFGDGEFNCFGLDGVLGGACYLQSTKQLPRPLKGSKN